MGKLILGIEEAGRGPVLGPLIISGVLIKESNIDKLIEIGIKDSKLLTPERRRELFPQIQKLSEQIVVKVVEPLEIDNRFTDLLNLNTLEGVKMIEIINELKPEKAIVDCPSTNIPHFTEFMKSKINHNPELIVEHKADINYPIVSAASIISKVIRDEKMKELETQTGLVLGSGYPADPNTQAFLKKYAPHLQKLPFVRNTWATIKNIIEGAEQKSVTDFF